MADAPFASPPAQLSAGHPVLGTDPTTHGSTPLMTGYNTPAQLHGSGGHGQLPQQLPAAHGAPMVRCPAAETRNEAGPAAPLGAALRPPLGPWMGICMRI